MNELTKKLVNQFATNLLNRSGYDMREYEPFISEAEKFAELIVGECLDIVGAGGEFASRPKLVEQIKQHFGVEE